VENHRWAWRPPHVHVVLVAESHVFTSNADLQLRVNKHLLPTVAQKTPEEFVRLIYCLGYGHNELLSATPVTPNTGTPQFWRIFARLAGVKHTPKTVEEKVKTLEQLCQLGVWLLDASLHAMYSPGGQRLVGGKQKILLHQLWWEHYGRYILDMLKTQNPALQVWVIGKGVCDPLAGSDSWTCTGWIYQPNARKKGLTFAWDHGWPELLAAVDV
jgi:hypothetical protein